MATWSGEVNPAREAVVVVLREVYSESLSPMAEPRVPSESSGVKQQRWDLDAARISISISFIISLLYLGLLEHPNKGIGLQYLVYYLKHHLIVQSITPMSAI